MDAQTRTLLQEILRRESRSFVQYVADAFPWTPGYRADELDTIRQVVETERAMLARLGQFLARQRIPLPLLGSFPASFTSFNFVSVEVILARLILDEEAGIAALERDLANLAPEAQALPTQLLELKRNHLNTLRSMQKPAKVTA